MRAEHFDQPFVFGAVLLKAFEFVAAGAERGAGRVAQRGDGARGLAVGVDQVLGQRADDAVAAGIDPADPGAVGAGRFDDAAGRGVDDRGRSPGLGVEGVAAGAHDGAGAGPEPRPVIRA